MTKTRKKCVNVTPPERMREMFGEVVVRKSVNIYSLRMIKEASAEYQAADPVKSPADAYKAINQIFEMDSRPNEAMVMLCFDTKNHVAGAHIISVGTLNSSLVHPREVFKSAMLNNASGIVIAHNHPSGDPSPSREDVETTQRLVNAGNILGISVLDHVVIGDNGKYISFREQGLMPAV